MDNFTRELREVAKNLRVYGIYKEKTKQGGRLLNKETIKVVNVGKPDIEAMSGSEQNTFFSELLTKISLLSKQQRAEQSVQRR